MKLNDLFLLDKDGKTPIIHQASMSKILKKVFKKEHGKPKSWDSQVRASYKQAKNNVKNLDPYTIRAFRSILKMR